jgi:periplasmic protein CpxP/Spy
MLRNVKFVPLYFAALLILGYSLPAKAQYGGSQQSTPAAQSEMHHGPHANRLEWLSKELNLTEEQKAKVKPILEDQEKQMHAIHEDNSLSQEQRHEKMMQLHETTHSQINAILTPDQQKKFAELKEQHMAHQKSTKAEESK